ncbi:bifunctional 2',3'-cyclic-nucleotide 2'-phosphodiesterase/3'-nucleotidase [Jannaschia sp. CCS1]|uniref:bifunctional 2',3'-cyclic-nucleotide 2'-phosphodiesterase/3'-nucleotidase n=1 Tax=Jannaschia sp. (strain CCS1) TaxID=290400 RepID=UPI00140F84E6|nr:bifunctional 2',3'-cyclic-nucleotide 2'-phosphodiesterase/3'-nucleotidase [Jannaschia sp. CCS1]
MTLPEQIVTAQGTAAGLTAHLRVLATTDLHAHLLPYDYYTDKRDSSVGLAQLGELVAAARAASQNILLLDNGDTLQGAPLADAAVAEIVPAGRLHPMIAAMNALGFDAATLGNHDFDFGLGHLKASLKGAKFPVVSANVDSTDGTPFVPKRCILTRQVTDSLGGVQSLKIGITGAVPPQVAMWNKPHLHGLMTFTDIVSAVRAEVAALRSEGADIVLVLAHSGYGSLNAGPGAENVALQVAQIEGVDGVVAGHTHKLRAEPTKPGAPIVQPGAFGSHLGCIDLVIGQADTDKGWSVRQTQATNFATTQRRALGAIPVRRMLNDYPKLRFAVAREHDATRSFVARPLGATAVPLETFFSVIAPCAATQVIADAQWEAARPLIAANRALNGLPVLSAVAPFKAGGRSGPRSYTDVPVGPLRLRHAADLYLYPNMLSVLRVTGQGVRDWLERSASLFHQIHTDRDAPQQLIDHEFAPYNFDRLAGLRYQIDVSRPARTNAEGDVVHDTPGRIHALTLADGTPLAPDDEVAVITNSYRSAGGGHMRAAQAAEEAIVAQFSVRDAVARYISDSDGPIRPIVEPTFSFSPLGGVDVVFETGSEALKHPGRAAELGLAALQATTTPDAFQPFAMHL